MCEKSYVKAVARVKRIMDTNIPRCISESELDDRATTHLDSLTLVWERAVEECGDDGHEGVDHITLKSPGKDKFNQDYKYGYNAVKAKQ